MKTASEIFREVFFEITGRLCDDEQWKEYLENESNQITLTAMESYASQKESAASPQVQLCPKCNGQGTVEKPPYVTGDVHQWSGTQTSYVCDVCHGAKVLYPFVASPQVGEGQTTQLTDLPEKIYLVTGLDEGEFFDVKSFKDLHEVAWCSDRQFYHDIEYSLVKQALPPNTGYSREQMENAMIFTFYSTKSLNETIADFLASLPNQ